jgi:hypothetical protein
MLERRWRTIPGNWWIPAFIIDFTSNRGESTKPVRSANDNRVMSASGHKRKSSKRANLFRFPFNSGHPICCAFMSTRPTPIEQKPKFGGGLARQSLFRLSRICSHLKSYSVQVMFSDSKTHNFTVSTRTRRHLIELKFSRGIGH